MSLFANANSLVTWKRSTAFILDSVNAAASHTGDRLPARESTVQVRLQGTPTGTVTVSGTVDGTPAQTEVLTWAGATGYRITRKRFTGAITFTLSQSGATTIEAKAMGTGGDPQTVLYTVKGPGHPVTVEEVNEGLAPVRREGSQEGGTHRILVQYEDVWKPRHLDRVVDDNNGDVYEIMKVQRKPEGGLYTTHWACKCKRFDAKGTT